MIIVRVTTGFEHEEQDHSFITSPQAPSPIFAGWGPKL